MKSPLIICIVLLAIAASCNSRKESKTEANTQQNLEVKVAEAVTITTQTERDTLKGSLKAIATGRIGSTFITINYHSPAVRDRVIWGGLVPFDQVWVTGAHMATNIEFEGPIKIGGQELQAGKYALFTIPSQNEWTVIINKNWEQHLTDEYDSKDDIVRLTIQPEPQSVNQERLMYSVDESGISIRWEKIKLFIDLK